MFQNERDYEPAVEALKPVLHNLPGKIIAIGGLPGVGKTSLGRYLAYRFNVSLIETDLFLLRGRGMTVYREDWINQVISSRIERDETWQRPVIIEGATVLRLLDMIERRPDFFIHVINDNRPTSASTLAADLECYDAEYAPTSAADITLNFSA